MPVLSLCVCCCIDNLYRLERVTNSFGNSASLVSHWQPVCLPCCCAQLCQQIQIQLININVVVIKERSR